MLFEPYARDLAWRLVGFDGELLETSAGTGRLTRALAESAPNAAITAVDLDEPLLAKAAELTRAPNVRFLSADAQALPFPAGRFEAVTCLFGVLPEKEAALAEAYRVLRPHGRFIFNVWDSLARNPISRVVHEALAALFPDDPPAFLERTPFGWRDREEIAAALERAGFRDLEVDTVAFPSRAPSAAHAAEGLCLGTPLRLEIAARRPRGLKSAVRAATSALEASFGAGPITAASQALVATAVR